MSRFAVYLQPPPVPVDDVFHDREPQSGTAEFPRAMAVGAVEPFRQTVEVYRIDPLTEIFHRGFECRATQHGVMGKPSERKPHASAPAAILNRVICEIGKDLHQLVLISQNGRGFQLQIEIEPNARAFRERTQ